MSRDGVGYLLRLVEEYGLEGEEDVQTLLRAAPFVESDAVAEDLRRILSTKAVAKQAYPYTGEPQSDGRIRLGETTTDTEFPVSSRDLNRHLLTVGQSGSGKTTLFYNLMRQLSVPFWAFDLKQDYRHLAQDRDDLLVLPLTEFKFNPLKPPSGVSPRRWAQVLSEIFGHATALLSGSKNYLLKQIIELYGFYNLFEDISPPFPSFHELEQLVRSDKMNYVRKQSNYRDTLLNRLEAMNLVAGTIFDCSHGHPIEGLLERDVVFEFDGLNRDVQNFLMEVLFAYVYEYRLALNERGGSLRHVFFLDEGKRVFSVYKERQEASGIPEIDELTAKMREFGEGLVVADQEASKLTESIRANTYTKVLLPVGSRKQLEAVSGSMSLSERQVEFAEKLGVGEAIVQVGNRAPVPVKLDDYSLEKSVSDEELRRLQADEWAELDFEPRRRTSKFESRIGPSRSEEVDERKIVDDPTQELELSDGAERLLRDVVEEPFRGLTERYEEGFSSRYKGNSAKEELVEMGCVVERRVNTGGGRRKLLELTEKGREYCEESLDLEPKHRGRGGIVHRYWQHRIEELFEEAGWTAELELFDADVYVNLHSSELVVEVAMGNNGRELEHVKSHLDSDFDHIWIVCPNGDVLEGLEQRLEENSLLEERIVFRLFRDFNREELPFE